MGLSQAQTIIETSFIPDSVEAGTVSLGETVRVAEARQPNGLYEALLLAVSFIFLLLGLLPSQSKQLSSSLLSDEEHRKIEG